MLNKPKWLTVVAICIYLFLYLPIFVLVLFSFDDSRLAVNWTGFTFKWYGKLLTNETLGSALLNSLIVAGCAVTASGIMGTLAAVGLTRQKFAGKGFYRAL